MTPAEKQYIQQLFKESIPEIARQVAKAIRADADKQSSAEWNAQLDPAELKRICSEKFKQRRKANA